MTVQKVVREELDKLLAILPQQVSDNVRQRENLDDLLEIVLDLGRLPEGRFPSGDEVLGEQEITRADLDYLVEQIGEFGEDNRAGIERTLHRISAIRNRKGLVVGITCRVGRAVEGTIKVIEDLAFAGKNILLLGRPGVGKTTMLREVARVLADDARKRVIIVDTSNEIAGDGDVPHPAIGHARRMQVTSPTRQHGVMIEAVENHMPQVIIIDEMGTEAEAAAARTIAERGVQLVATAHGNTLDNLIQNPTLSDLVGGVQTVTLGDQEARYRGTQKTVLERKAPPTFDVVVEIQSWEQVAVHDNVAHVVDQWLRGFQIAPEIRSLDDAGEVRREHETPRRSEGPPPWAPDHSSRSSGGSANRDPVAVSQPTAMYIPEENAYETTEHEGDPGDAGEPGSPESKKLDARVFLFGVSRDKVETAQAETGLSLEVVNELRGATLVLTTKTHYRRGSQLVRVAESSGTPIYVLRKNTMPQVMEFMRTLAKERGLTVPNLAPREDRESEDNKVFIDQAMSEAEEAAQRVLGGEFSVQLHPQRAYVRRLQHLLAQRFNVASTSRGREPDRSVLFYRQ